MMFKQTTHSKQAVAKEMAIDEDNRNFHLGVKNSRQEMLDAEVTQALCSVSKRSQGHNEIQNFKKLHNPRIYGMTEWLLQYENVCKQQDLYLQQVKELRQHFRRQESKKTHIITVTDKNITRSSFFWSSGIPHPQSDKRRNKASYVYHPKKNEKIIHNRLEFLQACDSRQDAPQFPATHKNLTTTEFLAPPPGVNTTALSMKYSRPVSKLPPIEDCDKKTDYEPIESIAQRNRLNMKKYFRVSSGKD